MISTVKSLFSRSVSVSINDKLFDAIEGESVKHLLQRNHIQLNTNNGTGFKSDDFDICWVRVDNKTKNAGLTTVYENMKIETKHPKITKKVVKALRKMNVDDKVLENSIFLNKNPGERSKLIDTTLPGIRLDPSRCLKCNKCVTACPHQVLVLDPYVQPFGNLGLQMGGCTVCGKCVEVCPENVFYYTPQEEAIDHVFKSDLEKVFILDELALVGLEEELGIKSNEDIMLLLGSMGIDTVVDRALFNDFNILRDCQRMFNRFSKGGLLSVCLYCHSTERAMFPRSPVQPYLQLWSLLDKTEFHTIHLSVCPSLRSEFNVHLDKTKPHSSIALTPKEFLNAYKRYKGTKKMPRLLACGSILGNMSYDPKVYSEACLRSFSKMFFGIDLDPKPFEYKMFNEHLDIAEVDLGFNRIVKVGSAYTTKAISDAESEGIMFLSVAECKGGCHNSTHMIRRGTDGRLSPDLSMKRDIKYPHENQYARRLYDEFFADEEFLKNLEKEIGL